MRITRHQMWMDIAHTVAKRSTCYRACVGAVIVRDRNILSIGYNGAPAGEPHCAGSSCERTPEGGCARSIHAEANAIMRCHCAQADLYCTDSPCDKCTNLVIASGIKAVFYSREYRNATPLRRLHELGILVYRLAPNGMLIDPMTNELAQ